MLLNSKKMKLKKHKKRSYFGNNCLNRNNLQQKYNINKKKKQLKLIKKKKKWSKCFQNKNMDLMMILLRKQEQLILQLILRK